MKNSSSDHPSTMTRQQIPHEVIARRAEKIWRDRSCPAGSDDAIWLEAESQLQGEAESKPVSGTPSRPYTDEAARQIRPQTKSRDPVEQGAQMRSGTDAKSRQSA